ncbi:DUF296 domain-containing protein [Candidatus Bipolaricaulota bacterium]|nr:DUF296 domain-containing protein [Candidatus Bipolaricaulota bacterium]
MIEARNAGEWVVRLQDGEALADGLRGLESNSALIVSGIGMVRDIKLGYWNGSEYEAHAYLEPAELLSLQGNLTVDAEGQRIVHVHISISTQDGSVRGGHLIAATVHNTLEMGLLPLASIALDRRPESNGLMGLFPRVL